MEVLRAYLPKRDDDTLTDDVGEVAGHTQYSLGKDISHDSQHEALSGVGADGALP